MKLSRKCSLFIYIQALIFLSGETNIVRAENEVDDDSDILAEIMAEAAAKVEKAMAGEANIKKVESEETIEADIPEVETPEPDIPEPETPEVTNSEPETAEVTIPEPETPEVTIPEPETPEVEIPVEIPAMESSNEGGSKTATTESPEAETEDAAVKESVAFGFSSIVKRGNDIIESVKNIQPGQTKKLVAGAVGVFGLSQVAGWTAAKGNAVDAVVAKKK